jgi:RNA polymerase sigma factor (sigma-70 family)
MPEQPESKQSENLTATKPVGRTGVFNAFQDHQQALRRFISRLVRRSHDIDDIAQETFLRAYNAEKNSNGDIEQPKSFLFKIAHNVAITNLTRKSNQMMDYLAEIDEINDLMLSPALVDEVIARQMVGIHCEAVASLPTQCRRVYLMRKVHGMTHKEIAEQLGISHRTVEKHIGKGIRDCANYVRERQSRNNSSTPAQIKEGLGRG